MANSRPSGLEPLRFLDRLELGPVFGGEADACMSQGLTVYGLGAAPAGPVLLSRLAHGGEVARTTSPEGER